MRSLTITTLLFFACQFPAQVSLDYTYENISGDVYNFGIIALDSNEYKYINIDYNNSFFELYNLDHTLYQVVDVPEQEGTAFYNLYYVTRTLFDCDDSNIEYLVSRPCLGPDCDLSYTTIYRADGSEIFHADSLWAAGGFGGVRQFNFPIYSTPEGTKLKLVNTDASPESSVSIYSICGSLPGTSQLFGIGITDLEDFQLPIDINAYPNPADELITISYSLPSGDNIAMVEIVDSKGQILQSIQVGKIFDSIQFNTSQLSAGTYFYRVVTSNGRSEAQRFIVSR